MKLRGCFVLVLGLLLPHFASADILPPGYRRIKHTIFLKGAKKFPKLHFILVKSFRCHDTPSDWSSVTNAGPSGFQVFLDHRDSQACVFALTSAQRKKLDLIEKLQGRLGYARTTSGQRRLRRLLFFLFAKLPRSGVIRYLRTMKASSGVYALKTIYEIRSVKRYHVELVKSEQAFDKAGKQIANPFANKGEKSKKSKKKKSQKGKKGKKRTSWLKRVPYKGPVFALGWGLLLFVGFRRCKL